MCSEEGDSRIEPGLGSADRVTMVVSAAFGISRARVWTRGQLRGGDFGINLRLDKRGGKGRSPAVWV